MIYSSSHQETVHGETSKPAENVYERFLEPRLTAAARKQELGCSAEWQFAAALVHLELRTECKEDDLKVGESEAGTGLQECVLSSPFCCEVGIHPNDISIC